MKRVLFLIVFAFSFSATAEDGHWKELYDFHTTMAARGSVEAEYKLGEMSEAGQGTAKDLQAAREWYLKAAEHGHVRAEYKLGTIYEDGIGVTADRNEAKRWYEKAAAHGLYAAERKLKAWGQVNSKKSEEVARQVEANKVRQAEQEKLRLEQKQKNEAELLNKKRVEEAKARQAAIARKRAAEQRPHQSAQDSEKTMQQQLKGKKAIATTQKEVASSEAVVTDGGEKEAFETDPCKTPAARFMSTCKNK